MSIGLPAPVFESLKQNGTNQVELVWTEVPDAYGYSIYRRVEGETAYKYAGGTVGSAKTTLMLSGVEAGQTYHYKVRGYEMVNGTTMYAYSSDNMINVRQKATSASNLVTTLTNGQSVTVTGEKIGSWYPVSCAGGTGYIFEELLIDRQITYFESFTMYTYSSDGNTVMRKSATSSSDKLYDLPNNTPVEVVGEAVGNWRAVSYNGDMGYIFQELLIPMVAPEFEQYGRYINSSDGFANFRQGAGVSYELIRKIYNNEKVTVIGEESGGWMPVYDEQTRREGYIFASLLSESQVSTGYAEYTMYTYSPTDGSTVVRSGPSSANTCVTSLSNNAEVVVTGDLVNNWYPVRLQNGEKGYIHANLLVPTYDEANNSIWVLNQLNYSDLQADAYGFGDKGERASIGSSGCGLAAYVNAVHYLTGQTIDIHFLRDYSLNHGFRINGEGTSHGLYRAFAIDYTWHHPFH